MKKRFKTLRCLETGRNYTEKQKRLRKNLVLTPKHTKIYRSEQALGDFLSRFLGFEPKHFFGLVTPPRTLRIFFLEMGFIFPKSCLKPFGFFFSKWDLSSRNLNFNLLDLFFLKGNFFPQSTMDAPIFLGFIFLKIWLKPLWFFSLK